MSEKEVKQETPVVKETKVESKPTITNVQTNEKAKVEKFAEESAVKLSEMAARLEKLEKEKDRAQLEKIYHELNGDEKKLDAVLKLAGLERNDPKAKEKMIEVLKEHPYFRKGVQGQNYGPVDMKQEDNMYNRIQGLMRFLDK